MLFSHGGITADFLKWLDEDLLFADIDDVIAAVNDLMGHSDIAVTLNVYTHVGLEDAENELRKMQNLEGARKEMGLSDKDDKPLKQNMFKVV